MTTEHLAEIFESEIAFPQLASMDERSLTRCTIAWMKDSGINDAEILKALGTVKGGYVCPDDLPDSLWNGSLLKRGRYYCHHALQLVSRSDIVKSDGTFISYPFYQEMKICFTIKDLTNYFYRHSGSSKMFRDDNRAGKQLEYMLDQYSGSGNVQAIDMILFLIDEVSYRHVPVTDPFSIRREDLVAEVADRIKRTMDRKAAEGMNHVTWRTYILNGKGEISWQRKQK